MNLLSSRALASMSLALSAGCAGVYAEATASQLSTTLTPSGGGTAMDSGGAMQVGFNLGIEFGNLRQRFAMGYAKQSMSLDSGSASLAGSSTRYDFNVFNIADRIKLRLGLGVQFGNGESDIGGMSESDSGGGYFAGVGGSYFLTWKNALHVLAGYQFQTQRVPGGDLAGSGPTFRVTLAHYFGDVRPDKSYVVPLESNRDITGMLEEGASSIGCVSRGSVHRDMYASVEVVCPGDRHIEYFQIAEGMLVTCKHTQSVAACKKLSSEIVDAVTGGRKKSEPSTTPAAQPAAAPQPPAPAATTPPPATDPVAAPATSGSATPANDPSAAPQP